MLRLSVDIGGTFTDIVLETNDGFFTHKLLTSQGNPEVAAIEGISTLLQQHNRPLADVRSIVHGTTLATNALIERRGARTALVTTEGFRDVLEMRNEKRFDQYALNIELPEPLVPRELRFTLRERVLVDGTVLAAPSQDEVATLARKLKQQNVEAVAVGFLNSYRYPQHEQAVAEQLRDLLDASVTLCQSADVAAEIREFDRFSTACANAYVRPLMSSYLGRFAGALASRGFDGAFLMMLSSGGLTTLAQAARTPIRLVESGPAGGALLAAQVSGAIGSSRTLALDIGGTTAKICFIENEAPQTTRRFEIARAWKNVKGSGLPVRVPTVELVEIGAGGGSIVSVDSLRRLAVGPESAGAQPGPCAYGQGGARATVTDAHIVVGSVTAEGFAGGVIALNPALSREAIQSQIANPLTLQSAEGAAAGVIEMANELMANAARVHGIELGKHIETFDLLVSGGGGALHATCIAEKLGIRRVVVPQNAGVGSAVGFLYAPVAFDVAVSVMKAMDDIDEAQVNAQLDVAIGNVTSVVKSVHADAEVEISIVAELRYRGQDLEFRFPVDQNEPLLDSLQSLKVDFVSQYQSLHGFELPGIPIELVSLGVTAKARVVEEPVESNGDANTELLMALRTDTGSPAQSTRPLYDLQQEGFDNYDVHPRHSLTSGESFNGPAIVAESQTTTIIRRGWSAMLRSDGHLMLERGGGS